MKARRPDPAEAQRVGLCATCRHAGSQENRRGNRFWRCLRAEADPRFRRYPALPVQACEGHEVGHEEYTPATSHDESTPS